MNEDKLKIKKFTKSFGYAFEGIKYAYTTGQNIVIMSIIGIFAIVFSIIFKISLIKRLIILVLIAVIISLELMNTAIEAVVDLHDKSNKSKQGKIAKDCASGALLVASIVAFIVGILIFLPYLIELF